MKKYRVKGYETVMFYVDIKAQNKNEAYTKAMDVNVLDWEQQSTVGLWDNGGFKIKKRDIEEIKKEKSWSKGYKKWRENNEN